MSNDNISELRRLRDELFQVATTTEVSRENLALLVEKGRQIMALDYLIQELEMA